MAAHVTVDITRGPVTNGPRMDLPQQADDDATRSPVKVVYIVGAGRSGSTLLQVLLAQVEGVFGAGEVRDMLFPGKLSSSTCGCGEPLGVCPFWKAVLRRAFPEAKGGLPPRFRDLNKVVRDQNLPLLSIPFGETYLRRRLPSLRHDLERLYRAVAVEAGASTIVDSSKSASYARVLSTVRAIDLYLIHLIRDPRGVEYSLSRRKRRGIPGFRSHNTAKGALVWVMSNLASELASSRAPGRTLRLRYEHLAKYPLETIKTVLSFIGHPSDDLSFLHADYASISPSHTAGGNRLRFRSGDIPIALDDAWKTQLPMHSRLLVWLLAWPSILHYR